MGEGLVNSLHAVMYLDVGHIPGKTASKCATDLNHGPRSKWAIVIGSLGDVSQG